ncbi:hypothetical protein Hypma_006293 [Hypsizygus marmoreus]|uniref:F-box domain-containing protein n=1 Tax=Hypsizygus marmoreus TaxID=39966 RepID=A0A369JWW8_HYPMA|nr:hypothetical protein Hypma_006293 [Hypsizygus marmoreus]
MSTSSLLYKLSLSDWERIAFYALASEDTFLGPPSVIHALSLVSRHVYNVTSVRNNSRLYARIFCFKFDYAAPARRLTERWLTSRCLAKELIARFTALGRIRRKHDIRIEDLWISYLLMSESDGKNESQLLEWAGLKEYLQIIVLTRLHLNTPWDSDLRLTSLIIWLFWMTTSRTSIQAEHPDINRFMDTFLRPFVTAGYRVPSVYGPDSYHSIPLCERITSTPTHCSGPLPPLSVVTHYGHELTLAAPTLTCAATLVTTVLFEALSNSQTFPNNAYHLPADRASAGPNFVGPTLEDLLRFHFDERIHVPGRCAPTLDLNFDQGDSEEELKSETNPPSLCGSKRYDEDWSRLVSCHDPRLVTPSPLRGIMFTIGCLAGSWEGRLLEPDYEYHVSALRDPRLGPRVPLYHKPLYWTLREHHCLLPNTPLCPGNGPEGDDDLLNAWLPRGIQIVPQKDAIQIFNPNTGFSARYETFIPGSKAAFEDLDAPWIPQEEEEDNFGDNSNPNADPSSSYIDDDDEWVDTVSHKSSEICDILITGETSERDGAAWGHFTLIGRVRPWDGLVVLLRSPRNPNEPHLGRWIFKGYVHDQNFVGRWRDTSTHVGTPGFEGGFVVRKADLGEA